MDALLILVLVAAWAAVLIPAFVRLRNRSDQPDPSLRAGLADLGRVSLGAATFTATPAPAEDQARRPAAQPSPAQRRRRAQHTRVVLRRRRVLLGLASAVGVAALSIPTLEGLGWLLTASLAVLLGAYLALLRELTVRRQTAARVSPLPVRRSEPARRRQTGSAQGWLPDAAGAEG